MEITSGAYWSAEDKTSFSIQATAQYQKELQSGNIKTASEEEINELILQGAAADGDEKSEIVNKLKEYGVYRLEPSLRIEENSAQSVHPDNGDVTINEPDIYLLPWNNRWVVACGGHWNNNSWLTSSLYQNVGDADAFGVGYTHTTGNYQSLVTASSAWISDESGEKKSTTTNRSDGDGALGFGFRLQDYIFDKSIIGSNKGYVGYKWAGDVTYDDCFGSYSFIATS